MYIDTLLPCVPNGAWRWTKSCHMIADSVEELHSFAAQIGLRRAWYQDGRLPHYDLNERRRLAAIVAGAVVVNGRREFLSKWYALAELAGKKNFRRIKL